MNERLHYCEVDPTLLAGVNDLREKQVTSANIFIIAALKKPEVMIHPKK